MAVMVRRLMAKNLITTIQVNVSFLVATFDFITFSPCSYFKGGAPFFTAYMFW